MEYYTTKRMNKEVRLVVTVLIPNIYTIEYKNNM